MHVALSSLLHPTLLHVVCLFCVTCKTVFAFFPRSHPSDEQLLTTGELFSVGPQCHPAFVLSESYNPLVAALLSAPFSQGKQIVHSQSELPVAAVSYTWNYRC